LKKSKLLSVRHSSRQQREQSTQAAEESSVFNLKLKKTAKNTNGKGGQGADCDCGCYFLKFAVPMSSLLARLGLRLLILPTGSKGAQKGFWKTVNFFITR